jgi:hypothetical protein
MRKLLRSASSGLLGLITALAVGMGASTLLALPAGAADGRDPNQPGAIDHEWSSETISLDWRGKERATVKEDSELLGPSVAVPGDRLTRTVTVRNAGPGDAELEVYFTDFDKRAYEDTENYELEHLVYLLWRVGQDPGSVRFSTAAEAGRYHADTIAVPKGASTEVTIGWELPPETEGGQSGLGQSMELDFGMELVMRGRYADDPTAPPEPLDDDDDDPTPVPTTPADAGQTPAAPAGNGPEASSRGDLPFTGTNAAEILFGAALLTLVGWLMAAKRRRERDDEQVD